ncbi:MAG TPA: hypothetical protein VHU89_12210 [Acidobacteriaceae bacterium]|nr:hypothetical protein [Acidobacteriaceae bacterium]
MKTRRPNPNFVPLTDADIARALASEHEAILPSSGFAASVMASIAHDASAPAPIPFPWKRAVPGIIAIAAVLALLIAVLVSMVLSAPAAPVSAAPAPATALDTAALFPFLRSTQSMNVVLWTAGTLGACIVSLVFFRRLLTSR